jgi:hypothetical protein
LSSSVRGLGRLSRLARLSGKDRRFIKRQKYNLLSRHENLTLEGKRSLPILLAANKRLNTASALLPVHHHRFPTDKNILAR